MLESNNNLKKSIQLLCDTGRYCWCTISDESKHTEMKHIQPGDVVVEVSKSFPYGEHSMDMVGTLICIKDGFHYIENLEGRLVSWVNCQFVKILGIENSKEEKEKWVRDALEKYNLL